MVLVRGAGEPAWITLEGTEGAGKSTQLTLLAEALRGRGIAVHTTREPGGTPLGEGVRALFLDPALPPTVAESELLLIYAARLQHWHDVIAPALAAGQWVLCDRFEDSTFAYQGGGRGVPFARIEELSRWALGDIRPHLTLWFDVDPLLGLERAVRGGKGDRLEQERADFHRRVAEGFRQRWQEDSQRMVRIDGRGTVAEVAELALAAVTGRFFHGS